MIHAIIADDEPLAREKVLLFSKDEPDLDIVEVCQNGSEVVQACQQHNPDLIFLDIQMPEMSGFEALQQLSATGFPEIIFITAYDEFALRAFEYHAIDYLLKPFNRERFHDAFTHAKMILTSKEEKDNSTKQISMLLDSLQSKSSIVNRFVVKEHGRIIFLKTEEIDWMEAAGNYIKFHCGTETHLIRETMNKLETQLDPRAFVRIHRSTIINIDRIKELQPWFNGDYKVILHNNRELTLSRGYRINFNNAIGKSI